MFHALRKGAAGCDWLKFISFAVPFAHRSNAQLLQDIWALWECGQEKPGYFVEFGACDGVSLSNSLLLERDFGWSGIVAEPDTRWHDRLQLERRCMIDTRCVWSQSKEVLEFNAVADAAFSTLSVINPNDSHERSGYRASFVQIKVETVSLLDLLDQAGSPKEIDYLSIDTEGSEYAILSAFDFSRYRFKLISVEHNYTPQRELLNKLLVSKGYKRRFEGMTRWDDWYVYEGLERSQR